MLISTVVYSGFLIALAGVVLLIRPSERLRVATRRRAGMVVAGGLFIALACLALPVSEATPAVLRTRLDEFVPTSQFREYHTIRIAAPPDRVFEALKRVRADEIFLFHTLTWLRRAGRPSPESILNAGSTDAIIDVAVRSGFARLADDSPREIVLGMVVVAPAGVEGEVTPDLFRRRLPPGFAVAAINFLVSPAGEGNETLLSTETRVYANSASARHRFGAYWRLIYPGSAIIRRSWLRAVAKRATGPEIQ